MILINILDGVYAKSTLKKKIKELEEEMKIDFSVDQDDEKLIRGLGILLTKGRGKAKVAIEEAIEKLSGGESLPSWEAPASISKDELASAVRKPSTPIEEKKTDLQILQDIFKKMNIKVD